MLTHHFSTIKKYKTSQKGQSGKNTFFNNLLITNGKINVGRERKVNSSLLSEQNQASNHGGGVHSTVWQDTHTHKNKIDFLFCLLKFFYILKFFMN